MTDVSYCLVFFLNGLDFSAVYEGTKSFYKEEDETLPVNVYGKSKVEAEHYISAHCQNYAILRSSIIYGPQTISPVPKSLPIQVNIVLRKHKESNCEYRSISYIINPETLRRSPVITLKFIFIEREEASYTYSWTIMFVCSGWIVSLLRESHWISFTTSSAALSL